MQHIINMREFGGLVNSQVQRIISGKLFRSGNPSVASEADCAQLKKLGLMEIVDFRADQEKRLGEQAFAKQFNWVAKPVLTGDLSDLLTHQLTKEKALECMYAIYSSFPTQFQTQFHYLLKQAEQGKTLLYHCTAGKDRTGFASLLLLSALGVSDELIMADYLLSNNTAAALKDQISDFMDDSALDPEALNVVLEVYPDYLENALGVINKEFGGMQRYLVDILAIDIKAIRAHYLEN